MTTSISDAVLVFDEAVTMDVIFLRFILRRNSSSDEEVRLCGSSLLFEGGDESGLVRMTFARLFLNVMIGVWVSFVGPKFDFASFMLMSKLFVRKGRPRMMPVDGDDDDRES